MWSPSRGGSAAADDPADPACCPFKLADLPMGSEDGSSSSAASSTAEDPEIVIHTRKEERDRPRFRMSVGDYLGLRPSQFVLRLATPAWLLTGMLCMMFCGPGDERQDLIGAVYMLAQLITTVGYGDIHPNNDGMRLFFACYVLVGNVLTALVITERLQKMVSRSHSMVKQNMVQTMKEDHQKVRGAENDAPDAHKEVPSKYGGAITALFIYIVFLLIGVVFYGLVDNCICPSLDCTADASCEEAGGRRRTIIEGFYMSAITLTTVGFGDEYPTSEGGRLFGIFWMLFGVASMANFLGEMAHLVLVENMQSVAMTGLSQDIFAKIDQDKSGTLTKFEFVAYLMVKYGMVSESDFEMLLAEFDGFDKDGSGELTYEEICGDMVDGAPDGRRVHASRREFSRNHT